MTGRGGADKNPPPPEINIEEVDDPSHLSVSEKVRKLSQTSATDAIPPVSPTERKGRNMANLEALRALIDFKQKSIKPDFEILEESLAVVPPDHQAVTDNCNYLSSLVVDYRKLHDKVLELLLKDPAKMDEAMQRDEDLKVIMRRFISVERQARQLLQPTETPNSNSHHNEDEDEHEDEQQCLTEKAINNAEAEDCRIAIESLEAVIDQTGQTREGLQAGLDVIEIRWGSYLEAQHIYINRLRQLGRVDEYQQELVLKKSLHERKIRLERRMTSKFPPQAQHQSNGNSGGGDDWRRFEPNRGDLPKLKGHPKEWLAFWAFFRDIDADARIPAMTKLKLLITATEEGSEARDIVTQYAMDPNSYEEAVQHLKQSFGRESQLIKHHVRELLEVMMTRATKKMEFRLLVNTITAQIKNLEILKVTEDKCSMILYPVIEACLPNHVFENWQKSPLFKEELKAILKFLQLEVNNEADRKLARFNFLSDEKKKPDQQQKDNHGHRHNQKGGDRGRKGAPAAAAAFQNKEVLSTCVFCGGKHKSKECKKALQMTFAEKQQAIKDSGSCFICLERGHMSKSCPNTNNIKCDLCLKSKVHLKVMCHLLHEKKGNDPKVKTEDNFINGSGPSDQVSGIQSNVAGVSPQPVRVISSFTNFVVESSAAANEKETVTSNPSPRVITDFTNATESTDVPLQMLLVTVEGTEGKVKRVRAMMDSGSQRSYVTQNVADAVKFLHVGEETVVHHLFGGGTSPSITHQRVKLLIGGPNGEQLCTFTVGCIPKIAEVVYTPPKGAWVEEFRRQGVTFADYSEIPNRVDVLIGNDVGPKLYSGRKVELSCGPIALETRWGWTFGGKIPCESVKPCYTRSLSVQTITMLSRPIQELWDLECLGIRDEPTTQSKRELEQQTEAHFLRTVRMNEEGRYEVRLPFLTGTSETIPTNFLIAERRLRSTTAELKKKSYVEDYDFLFKQWEEDRMIEQVPDTEERWRETGHFLPHRAVVKLSSTTTPIRPVFDASAKAKDRPSLNMCLEAGPNYLELIPSILTRFRLNRIGVTADIKKAFQQISIAPEDREYLKFLWWKDITTCRELKPYRHRRVVFGVTSSPYLLTATLNFLLSQAPASHQDSAELLKKSLYVDNNVASLRSEVEALHFRSQCRELLEPAAFDLRGWEIGPTIKEKIIPVLGLSWNMRADTLCVEVAAALEKIGGEPTQRIVLSIVHSLYDPLGMLSPFIIVGKGVLRKCHEEKVGWDKPLPSQLTEEFRKWSAQITYLKEAAFPRYVFYDIGDKRSLHVFTDASGEAYAAAVFFRCETREEVKVNLLMAKARIAPKKVTIPRLELLGCLIGVRLAKTVAEDIGGTPLPISYYTDSATALAWIKGEGPWGVFVANRVQEIRDNSHSEQWRHVPGKANPADLPSRGCSAKKMLAEEWWMGPDWLYLDRDRWPLSRAVNADQEAVEKEKKKCVVMNVALSSQPHPMQYMQKFSSYTRILRVTSYCLRYRQILLDRIRDPTRKKIEKLDSSWEKIRNPTLHERTRAEIDIFRFVQADLKDKQLRKLRPFQDNDGVWRTATRVLFQFRDGTSHPVILPDNNKIVETWLGWMHKNHFHIGTQLLLAKVRENFWLLNGRRACRKAVYACWICRTFRVKRLTVPEPPLPDIRSTTGVPFRVTGVDFAGPLTTKKAEKVWVALFTCATYRAVHLEVVDGMSTDEFLVAFRAFVCRRGKPAIVHSDNGLNFVGADAELRRAYLSGVREFATEEQITWRWNPPATPWWGGYWEKMVGLMKSLVKSTLGNKSCHRKELVALLMEVEEALNNRPLTYLSESPDDPVPLTPNMFVRNSGLSFFPEMDIRDGTSARAAHRRVQRLREALRSRFRTEYLGALQHQRLDGKFGSLKPGDVVLIEKDNEKRIGWPLAVIVEAIPGADGFPRAYRVRTKLGKTGVFGILPRLIPAQKLFPMELENAQDKRVEVEEERARAAAPPLILPAGETTQQEDEGEVDEQDTRAAAPPLILPAGETTE